MLMATPYLDEAERCSRVALLHEGALLALDEPGALRAALPGAVFEVMVDDHRAAQSVLDRLPDVVSVSAFGERIHVRVRDLHDRPVDWAAAMQTALEAKALKVDSVRPVAASLEDVFIARLGEPRS